VQVQPVQSKLPINNNNVQKLWHLFDIRADIIVKLFIVRGVRLIKIVTL